jgi:hypothetical protein
MHPKKQVQNQKLRKVQGIYRKKGRKSNTHEDNLLWRVFAGICMLAVFFFFVLSVLFDIGIHLPPFFGK